jgi:hypothetical protein
MFSCKKTTTITAAVLVMSLGIAWASGDWSGARSKVDELKSKQMDLRKLTPDETRKIVTAICEVDEDERKKVGEDAAERVARTVNSQLGELRNVRDQSYRLLDDVVADEASKDKRDEAKQMKDDVQKRWDSIEKMAENAMRGANNPLVSFMIRAGQDAHKDYQRNCDAAEVPTGSRIADCVMADGETCLVIELKPDNSRAISRGKTQLKDQVDDLNAELKKPDSSIIKNLIGKDSDLAKCKRFEGRIDCYKLCPDVSEDGTYREARADWKKDCS